MYVLIRVLWQGVRPAPIYYFVFPVCLCEAVTWLADHVSKIREINMGIVVIIITLSFVVAAFAVLNNGTVDKEYKRRQAHWEKYQGKAMTVRNLSKAEPKVERRGLVSRLIGRGDMGEDAENQR